MMDQQAWDRIYDEIEADLETVTRGAGPHAAAGFEAFVDIDRARFAMARGDTVEAIGLLQALERQLTRAVAGDGATRGSGPLPSVRRLESLEDELHASLRLGSARLEVVGDDTVDVPDANRGVSPNAKVIRSIAFADIADEYVRLFDTARINGKQRSTVNWYTSRIVGNRETYDAIQEKTGVPWWFTGLIHGMECSFSTRKHLHNGDPLTARTRQVPAGRPEAGDPPFSFVDSAVDALAHDGFAGKSDWGLAIVLYRLERYNGFGYRRKFGTVSPYLWSFCNHYVSGKYVHDGVYDADKVSNQCGTAATLRALMEDGVVSFETPPTAMATALTTAAGPKPVPQAPARPLPVPVAAATAATAPRPLPATASAKPSAAPAKPTNPKIATASSAPPVTTKPAPIPAPTAAAEPDPAPSEPDLVAKAPAMKINGTKLSPDVASVLANLARTSTKAGEGSGSGSQT